MAVGANAVTVVDYEKDFTDGTYAMWHSEATDISSRFKIDTKRVYRIIGKRYAETMLEIHKSQTGINSIFADKKQGTGKWFDLSGRNVGNLSYHSPSFSFAASFVSFLLRNTDMSELIRLYASSSFGCSSKRIFARFSWVRLHFSWLMDSGTNQFNQSG